MARKRRKTSAGKRKKKSKPVRTKPVKSKRVKKKASAAARKVRRQQPKTFSDKVASAYHTVVDTIKGTDELRNKMEPPATSETE